MATPGPSTDFDIYATYRRILQDPEVIGFHLAHHTSPLTINIDLASFGSHSLTLRGLGKL